MFIATSSPALSKLERESLDYESSLEKGESSSVTNLLTHSEYYHRLTATTYFNVSGSVLNVTVQG